MADPPNSFKFLNSADRDFWIELRGSQIDIEVVECGEQEPVIDQADEEDQKDQPSVPDLLEAPSISRDCLWSAR